MGKLLLLHLAFLGWVSVGASPALFSVAFQDCELALHNDCCRALLACGGEISAGLIFQEGGSLCAKWKSAPIAFCYMTEM